MVQTLERLFIEKYEHSEGSLFIKESQDALKMLSISLSKETLNEDYIKVIQGYIKF